MSKSNGQTEVRPEEEQKQELEHELPPADLSDGFEEKGNAAKAAQAASAESTTEAELQKLRGERDNLLDRVARLQAEFENARKRAAKENADYRDFAVAEAARALLPVIDNFNLALKNTAGSPEDFRKGVELIHK